MSVTRELRGHVFDAVAGRDELGRLIYTHRLRGPIITTLFDLFDSVASDGGSHAVIYADVFDMVDTRTAADRLGISTRHVRQLCAEGRLPGARQNARNSAWSIPSATIEAHRQSR